jgi:hypothetical protein
VRPVGLRVQLAVGAGVLSAIAIAILATAAYLAAATDLRSAVDDKLVGRVEFVRNASAAELPPFDDTEADTVTSSESTEPTIPPDLLGDEGLEVFTPSGDRFLSQIDGLAFAPDLSTEELAVIDGDATGPVTRSMRRDDDYVRTSMGAITGGGTVRFSKDTSDIEAGLSALRTRMALGAVGAGLLVAVAAWWFAGRFVAPVTVVAEAAEELARTQDLPSRLDESRAVSIRWLKPWRLRENNNAGSWPMQVMNCGPLSPAFARRSSSFRQRRSCLPSDAKQWWTLPSST